MKNNNKGLFFIMETLIVHPKNEEQLSALKTFMKVFKVDFQITNSGDDLYSVEFVTKIKQGEEDVAAGRTTKIEPANIWNLG